MTLLKKLINDVKEDNNRLPSIKDKQMLLSSLEELDQLIGLKRIKESIASQCMTLLKRLKDGESIHGKINTVIYGPPGVGKTTVGKILAKIFYSIGFLQGGNEDYNADETPQVKPFRLNKREGYLANIFTFFFWAFLLLLMLSFILKTAGWVVLGSLFLILLIMLFSDREDKPIFSQMQSSESSSSSSSSSSIEDNLTVVAGREDLVAGYLGQSGLKTREFLHKHAGKAILVDEAYTLLENERDDYGKQALAVITSWMTEHPTSSCFIFMGYREEMTNGIFRLQPGLKRRFLWQFDCDGYTPKEMWKILSLHMEKRKIVFAKKDSKYIKKFFLQRAHQLTAYGGDIEKLCDFMEMEIVKECYLEDSKDKICSGEKFVFALSQLQENSITREKSIREKPSLEQQEILNKLLKELS